MSDNGKPLQTRDKRTTWRIVRGAALLEMRRARAFAAWEFNRSLDEARVARMTQDQQERLDRGDPLTLFLPTPVVVCTLGAAQYLMDGQHRLAALATLAAHARQEIAKPAQETELLLCTVACATDAELEETFVRINSGTPVPAAYYAKKVDTLLAGYCERLIGLWPQAHSQAEHPHRPSFNVRRVKDAMSALVPLRDAVIDGRLTVEALVDLTEKENRLAQSAQGTLGAEKAPERCLKGAAKSGFYLGLRKEWAALIALRAVSDLDA